MPAWSGHVIGRMMQKIQLFETVSASWPFFSTDLALHWFCLNFF
jgi:hypothetical protein